MIITVALILLALIGAPLFTLFGAAAIVLFLDTPGGGWAAVAIDVFSTKFAENPSLMTIPLFTFAGYLLAESGMPMRLIEVSRAWLGWMPGGLAIVCLGASAFFTTFTGGSGITIVAVGGLLLPTMLREGYPSRFAYGLVTTGGSLGILFPPSVPIVMYGLIAGMNMEKLLVAGIVPGIVVCVVLGIYSGFIGLRSNFTAVPFNLKRALRSLWVFKWEAAIPVVLLVGFGTGVLRIHEASAFTALYVLIIEVFVYRDISIRKDLPRVVIDSMTLVGAILIILSCGVAFTGWMIQAEIPTKLLEWMETLVHSKFVFLLVLNVFLIIVGMLMEIFTAIVVAVPLVVPLAELYHLDPYHFAIIFLLNLEIAYLAPPLGINLFIASLRFGKPVTYLYRSVLMFIGVLFATLMLICYVPEIVTWLPNTLKVGEDSFNLKDLEAPSALPDPDAEPDLPALPEDDKPGDADDEAKPDSPEPALAPPADEAKPTVPP